MKYLFESLLFVLSVSLRSLKYYNFESFLVYQTKIKDFYVFYFFDPITRSLNCTKLNSFFVLVCLLYMMVI